VADPETGGSATGSVRSVLQAWVGRRRTCATAGRWAIERLADSAVVGGLVIRLLPPRRWTWRSAQPEEWATGMPLRRPGRFALGVHPGHRRAVCGPSRATRAIATCERLLLWVGETNKYYDRRTLQVHRIRPADLDDS
jgi:hypothetical protein